MEQLFIIAFLIFLIILWAFSDRSLSVNNIPKRSRRNIDMFPFWGDGIIRKASALGTDCPLLEIPEFML